MTGCSARVLVGVFWAFELEHDVFGIVHAFDADGGVLRVVETGNVVVLESEFDRDPDCWLYRLGACLVGGRCFLVGVVDAGVGFLVRGGGGEREMGCDCQVGLLVGDLDELWRVEFDGIDAVHVRNGGIVGDEAEGAKSVCELVDDVVSSVLEDLQELVWCGLLSHRGRRW